MFNTKFVVICLMFIVIASDCSLLQKQLPVSSAVTPKAVEATLETAKKEVVGYQLKGLDGEVQIVVLITQVTGFKWNVIENGSVLCGNQPPSVTVKAILPEFCDRISASPNDGVSFGITNVTPHDVVKFNPYWNSSRPLGFSWSECQIGTGWFNSEYDNSGRICKLVEEILR